jgi:hypothetical protein
MPGERLLLCLYLWRSRSHWYLWQAWPVGVSLEGMAAPLRARLLLSCQEAPGEVAVRIPASSCRRGLVARIDAFGWSIVALIGGGVVLATSGFAHPANPDRALAVDQAGAIGEVLLPHPYRMVGSRAFTASARPRPARSPWRGAVVRRCRLGCTARSACPRNASRPGRSGAGRPRRQ